MYNKGVDHSRAYLVQRLEENKMKTSNLGFRFEMPHLFRIELDTGPSATTCSSHWATHFFFFSFFFLCKPVLVFFFKLKRPPPPPSNFRFRAEMVTLGAAEHRGDTLLPAVGRVKYGWTGTHTRGRPIIHFKVGFVHQAWIGYTYLSPSIVTAVLTHISGIFVVLPGTVSLCRHQAHRVSQHTERKPSFSKIDVKIENKQTNKQTKTPHFYTTPFLLFFNLFFLLLFNSSIKSWRRSVSFPYVKIRWTRAICI